MRRALTVVILLVVLLVTLAACGSTAKSPTQLTSPTTHGMSIQVTQSPTPTPTQTQTPNPTPTLKPSPTPIPTPTPTLTPKQNQYIVSTSVSPPEGGTVSPRAGTYDSGTSVTLMASPSAGYQFASWSGNAYGTSPTITITMDTNKNVTANFTLIPTPTLTLTPTTVPSPASGDSQLLSHAEYLFNSSAVLIASNGNFFFLGKITNKYDSDSVLNKYGNYGSKYSSDSIWNKYGDYGGKYSSYSPFNRYTSSPPKIYIGDTFWGYLSTNKYLSVNVLDPNELLMFAYLKYNDVSYLNLMVN